MTIKKLEEIFETVDSEWEGDNALQGLLILQKYSNGKDVLQAAEHDIIYSIGIDEAIQNGLTEEDATALAKLNWSLDSDSDSFACFV